jgi:hypothetical protein
LGSEELWDGINMKNFFKRITGIEKLEQEKAEALAQAEEARLAAEKAKREEETAKMTPKERATAKGEPYISVLETHVNKDNLRNGFFELDWNDQFVLQLKQEGYGFDGDPDEEIVDRWFRTLCKDIGNEEGVDMTDRGAGYINVKKIAEGRSEVS